MATTVPPSLIDYVEPWARVVDFRTNAVPGYVTARLAPRIPWEMSGATYANAPVTVSIRNLSDQTVTPIGNAAGQTVIVRFQQTDGSDYPVGVEQDLAGNTTGQTTAYIQDISGGRTNLASAVQVVPGGRVNVSFTPTQRFVEFKGISGTAPIWCQIETTMNWDVENFTYKKDYNAPTTWSGLMPPPATAATASQTFTSNTTWTVTHNLGYVATPTLMNNANPPQEITSLATFSNVSTSGYTATFVAAQAGTAYSTP